MALDLLELSLMNLILGISRGIRCKSGSFDGQYFHHSAYLIEVLNLSDQFVCACDLVHKEGAVDSHTREGSNFMWFLKIQTRYKEVFSKFD